MQVPEAVQQPQVEEPFSLAPAIFTLFPGFPRDAPPLDRDEKLQKIIENLDRQHDAVRKNMMFLIERRADDLVKRAKNELSTLEHVEPQYQRNALREKDLRDMLQRTKVPMKADAKPGAYEITEDTFKVPDPGPPEPDLFIPKDPDVEMGNTTNRTHTSLREDLTHAMRDLVMRGASEMEAYDAHAETTTKKYRDWLGNRKPQQTNPPAQMTGSPASALPPRGILSNRHVKSPINRDAIRRTSENYEDLARR